MVQEEWSLLTFLGIKMWVWHYFKSRTILIHLTKIILMAKHNSNQGIGRQVLPIFTRITSCKTLIMLLLPLLTLKDYKEFKWWTTCPSNSSSTTLNFTNSNHLRSIHLIRDSNLKLRETEVAHQHLPKFNPPNLPMNMKTQIPCNKNPRSLT